MCTVAYVFCVVSRLQGDSLSESRSEEEHRPHVAEQAVPDISCMLHNKDYILFSYTWFCVYTYIYMYIYLFSFLCFHPPCSVLLFFLSVHVDWFSSLARGGRSSRTIAGM